MAERQVTRRRVEDQIEWAHTGRLQSNRQHGLFPEYAADPDPPTEGGIVYVIADNGAGKRELRVLFPTGAAQAIATEP